MTHLANVKKWFIEIIEEFGLAGNPGAPAIYQLRNHSFVDRVQICWPTSLDSILFAECEFNFGMVFVLSKALKQWFDLNTDYTEKWNCFTIQNGIVRRLSSLL